MNKRINESFTLNYALKAPASDLSKTYRAGERWNCNHLQPEPCNFAHGCAGSNTNRG